MPEMPPTERLYFTDSYLYTFESRVVALTEFAGRPAVVLDATAFYPEGGGQPADHGTLGDVAVVDVQEADDRIYHILADPLAMSVGTMVTGTIDHKRRFDFMQQHTGQHTISGAFYHLLGAATTSWRLGSDVVTIDIAHTGLSDMAIAEAEHLTNEILWRDLAVTAAIYSKTELARLEMRKGSDRDGGIRVVSIGDFDRIGCGGTHVATTGQVGAIGIRRWETRGQGSRIEFVCGARALSDYAAKTAVVNAVGAALSAKPEDIVAQISRLQHVNDDQRHEISDLRKRLTTYEVLELLATTPHRVGEHPIVCARFDEREMNDLRLLAQRIAESGGIGLIGGINGEKAQLAFACDKTLTIDLNAALKAALPLVDGKGGGQKFSTQGGGTNVAGLDAALEHARMIITSS